MEFRYKLQTILYLVGAVVALRLAASLVEDVLAGVAVSALLAVTAAGALRMAAVRHLLPSQGVVRVAGAVSTPRRAHWKHNR